MREAGDGEVTHHEPQAKVNVAYELNESNLGT